MCGIEINSPFFVTQIALHYPVRAVSRNFAILCVGVNATDRRRFFRNFTAIS